MTALRFGTAAAPVANVGIVMIDFGATRGGDRVVFAPWISRGRAPWSVVEAFGGHPGVLLGRWGRQHRGADR